MHHIYIYYNILHKYVYMQKINIYKPLSYGDAHPPPIMHLQWIVYDLYVRHIAHVMMIQY